MPRLDRRELFAASAAGLCTRSLVREAAPVRALTRGPRHHWFGYYDKFQTDPGDRFVLGMEVGFQHRSPRAGDRIGIGMVDLHKADSWIELGHSRAFGWQQGCMLQWRPGSASEVLWNDCVGGRFVCHVLDIHTRERRTLPHAIYTLSPDGKTGLGVDFARLQEMRPGYGYAGGRDAYAKELMPKASGIYRVDLDSGARTEVISLHDLVARTDPDRKLREAKHYFNHLLFSPDGSRFIFLHRWRQKGKRGFMTRMFTAAPDGSDLYLLDPSGYTSHFIWRDPETVLAWSHHASAGHAFYLFGDRSERVEVVDKERMPHNGHCTYLKGGEWILNDTYPRGKERRQEVYLYRPKTRQKIVLGRFHSPREFRGEWRCDTHPRASRSGRQVIIDSPHLGGGRQMYLLDIAGLI